MSIAELGANEFTLDGDRTTISFLTQTPGPIKPGQEGGRLVYQGIEGNLTLFGHDIAMLDSPLGTLLTITFERNPDVGGLSLTVLLPRMAGTSMEENKTVTFETIAVKASSPGNIAFDGAQLRYTLIPLLGTARNGPEPL